MNQSKQSDTKPTENAYKFEIPELPKWLNSKPGKFILVSYFVLFLGVGLFEGEFQVRRPWVPPVVYTPFFLGGYALFTLVIFSFFRALVLPKIQSLETLRKWRDESGTKNVLWHSFLLVWFFFIWLMMSWGVILGARHLYAKVFVTIHWSIGLQLGPIMAANHGVRPHPRYAPN